jgi:chorismate-pyruvate lyase
MSQELSFLYPLDLFYAAEGRELPPASPLAGAEVPEPYRRLIVHEHDMTPTLEAFHGERIHLRLLARRQEGDAYARQVVLTLDGSERPVEFGAIVIHLQHFPAAAREMILEGYCPLGTILAQHHIEHTSRPLGFLRVMSDANMNAALGLDASHSLFGRRNVLWDRLGNSLAEILEILPPES